MSTEQKLLVITRLTNRKFCFPQNAGIMNAKIVPAGIDESRRFKMDNNMQDEWVIPKMVSGTYDKQLFGADPKRLVYGAGIVAEQNQ